MSLLCRENRAGYDAVTGEELIAELDRPGQVLLVPKGCWHTAHPLKPTRIVFITPGEGTENVADPRAEA